MPEPPYALMFEGQIVIVLISTEMCGNFKFHYKILIPYTQNEEYAKELIDLWLPSNKDYHN